MKKTIKYLWHWLSALFETKNDSSVDERQVTISPNKVTIRNLDDNGNSLQEIFIEKELRKYNGNAYLFYRSWSRRNPNLEKKSKAYKEDDCLVIEIQE